MWTRQDLKEKAKLKFKANYWMTVLAALILMIVIGAAPTISYKIGPNSIKRLAKPNFTTHTDLSELGKVIDEAAEEAKTAINDLDEDDQFDTNIVINGQEIFSAKAAGLNEENKEQVNEAIDSIADTVEDAFSSPDTLEKAILSVAIPIIALIVIISIIASLISIAIEIFLKNPLEAGGRKFFMENHTAKGTINAFSIAFKSNYMNVVKTLFLRDLYTFLWSLLLVIPGIIKAYEYRMIPFLLAEDTGMDYQTAFDKSKEMMEGHKWNAFVLDLSFIGWHLLSVLTCGILNVFYVNPYKFQTDAELYYAIKDGGNNTASSDNQEYASYVEVE